MRVLRRTSGLLARPTALLPAVGGVCLLLAMLWAPGLLQRAASQEPPESEAGAAPAASRAPPRYEVPERAWNLDYWACSDCHEVEPVNRTERELEEEHTDIELNHGDGNFWCLDCHDMERNGDVFVSLRGEPIDFDAAYRLCGRCHFEQKRDWEWGAHGKRVGTWNEPREIPRTHDEMDVSEREEIGTWGEPRVIHSCPACHNPHTPAIGPFEPSPPPPVRKGLLLQPARVSPEPRAWERNHRARE